MPPLLLLVFEYFYGKSSGKMAAFERTNYEILNTKNPRFVILFGCLNQDSDFRTSSRCGCIRPANAELDTRETRSFSRSRLRNKGGSGFRSRRLTFSVADGVALLYLESDT